VDLIAAQRRARGAEGAAQQLAVHTHGTLGGGEGGHDVEKPEAFDRRLPRFT